MKDEMEIRSEILEILKNYRVSSIDDFKDDLDSLSFISLIIDIENSFDIVISNEELVMDKFCKIDYIVNYLKLELK